MSEDSKHYTLKVIETELAVIIVLLSVFIFKYYINNEDNEDN